MGQAEINSGGLSQEGSSQLRESELRMQPADLWWPEPSTEQSEAICLLGWMRGQEREVRD